MPENRESRSVAIFGFAMASDDEFAPDLAGLLDQVRHGDNRFEQAHQIDETYLVSRQFGIEPGSVGYVADQPVEPADVVRDNRQQTLARFRGASDREGLDRAAQGGERVFQFRRDIRGKALNRLDAIVEGLGHIAEGAGQMADFIRAAGEIGDFTARLRPPLHALRRLRQAPNRFGYRSGDEIGEKKHNGGRNEENPENGSAFRGNDFVDVIALRGQEQGATHGPETLDRHRDGDNGFSLGIDPHD